VLETVKRELKTAKAKRELSVFEITHKHLLSEFKDLNFDEQAILDAIGLAQEAGEESLIKRLRRMVGRDYYQR